MSKSQYSEREMNPKPTVLGSAVRGGLLGSAIVGRRALMSKAESDTLPSRLGATALGGAGGAAMGMVMHPIRLALWRAFIQKQRAQQDQPKSAAFALGEELGWAVKMAEERVPRANISFPDKLRLMSTNSIAPAEGTGAVANIVASIANILNRRGRLIPVHAPAGPRAATYGGAALGALAGGLPSGEREQVVTGPGGEEWRETVRRTPAERISRAAAGALIGGGAGYGASRGFIGRSLV
jgi:hypothetical protein